MLFDIYEALLKSGMNTTEALLTLNELVNTKDLNEKIKDFVKEMAEDTCHCPECFEETEFGEDKDYLDDSGVPEMQGYRHCPCCGWKSND